MTAVMLLAEEPEIGWRVFLLIMAVSVIGTCAVAVLMLRSVRWHSDAEDYTRRVELGAAALGKGAKR